MLCLFGSVKSVKGRRLMFGIFMKSRQVGIVTRPQQEKNKNFGRSWHIRHVDCGSCNGCDWEMNALLNPIYDLQRYGLDFVASPRHADILMVTGAVTKHLQVALTKTYEATPAPKLVVAVGDCACNGGIFKDSYATLGGAEKAVPVSIKIPGCPPSPQDMLDVLLNQLKKKVV